MISLRILIPFLILTLLCSSCAKNIEEEYYSDGKLKLKAELKDGKRHGLLKAYAENGKIDYLANYCEGTPCGDEIKYYYGTGIRAELNRFDEKGKKYYGERYDTTGTRTVAYYLPDLLGRKTPLKLGQEHTFTIEFTAPINGKLYAVVGESDQYNNKHPKITKILDTLYSKDSRTFPFKFVPKKLGTHYLTGIVYHESLKGDSLWVNGTSVKYAFEVLE